MLSALRKNSLSIVLSSAAIAGFGAWLALPESASIQSIYDRYIAREESRPRVFEEGIAVRLNREAPPVAALEEALRDQPWAAIEPAPGFNVRPTELRALPAAPERMAIRLLSENENFNRAHSRALDGRMMEAQIDMRVRPYAPATMLPATTPIAPPVVLPQNRMRAEAKENRRGVSFMSATNGRRLESLTVVDDAAAREPSAAPSSKTISLSKTGLTREQILAALFVPMSQNTGAASTPASGYSAPLNRRTLNGSPAQPPQPEVKPSRSGGSLLAYADLSATAKPEFAAPAVKPEPSISDADASAVASQAMGMVAPAGRQIMIRGTIEFSDGLALTHAKDRIAVLRESRGQFIESGAVWIREARYEIFVESLEGMLVAEVRSPQGEVVGRGRLELSSLTTGANGKTVEGVALRVMPVTPGIAGRAQSTYSSISPALNSKGVQGARVDFRQTPATMKTTSGGHFEDSRFVEGSRVVANIQAKEHWPTLAMLTGGQETVVPLFSRKMMEAFVGLTSKDESSAKIAMKSTGVIWGRVTRAGQTVADAKIDVITEGAGEPIYFNDLMLPDSNLKSTGSNGLFAVPAASAGVHAVQVRLGKRLSDPVFMATDVASVSALELDVLKASEVQARAFDAFRTDLPLRVEVRPMGHIRSRKMVVQGDGGAIVKLAHLGLPSILEVEGGADYLSTRIIQNSETRNLYLPMVERAWFDRVIGQARYNNPPRTGNVLGFIQGTRFRVSMDEKSLSAGAKVIYFDARGEVTTREYGEPGGGFILLGVNNGLQTVVVESEGSDRIFAATVLIEDGYVASLSHWLR